MKTCVPLFLMCKTSTHTIYINSYMNRKSYVVVSRQESLAGELLCNSFGGSQSSKRNTGRTEMI